MKELFRQMFSLVTECNNRKSAQSVIDQKIQMLFQQIAQVRDIKLDFKDFVQFQADTEFTKRNHHARLEQLQDTLRHSIDYMLRYQWKETRNIVNRALYKVTRPLQLKDLFYDNVVEFNPQLFYDQQLLEEA